MTKTETQAVTIGSSMLIQPDGFTTITHYKAGEKPTLEDLQAMVGGLIEVVPGLGLLTNGKQVRECVAFCNEEGRIDGLEVNEIATSIYQSNMLQFGFGEPDPLHGPVVFFIGQEDFLKSF